MGLPTTQPTSTTSAPPKAIIFDLLTALLDSWTVWDASVPATSQITGRQWRTRYLALTFSQGRYVPYEDLVRQSAAEVGLPVSVAETLLRDWALIQPWPEVPRVLARLRAQGVKLGVVTNCSRVLGGRAVEGLCARVREEKGGEGFEFDVVVTAEESGWYKPVKEAYAAGIEALGLSPEEILFVAGSAGDVGGASRAGMRVVWNNHAGLELKGNEKPLVEGKTLDEALEAVLPPLRDA